MNVSHEVADLAVRLSEPASRKAAAAELSRLLGADELLLFVRDPEVDQLLTVAEMPQTLPDGARWRTFLSSAVREGIVTGELPFTRRDELLPAYGRSSSPDAVLVLLGTARPTPVIEELSGLLPLLATACRGEAAARIAQAQIAIAHERTEHAIGLARALGEANDLLQDQASELEMQAEELQRARELADSANRAKSEFLTTMSHELRTPLNAISGYVDLLDVGVYGRLNDAQRNALHRISGSQRHLLQLINDILSLARIEAGGIDYNISKVDLRELVSDLLPLIGPQAENKQLTLVTQLEENSLVVQADRDRLGQILLNLLSNAVKFTEIGGRITIRTGFHDAQTTFVSVADTGRGIPADKLKSIFDPFVQVQTGPTRSIDGAGLGLAISRDLASGMGGRLTVESELGRGSVFTVLLPRKKWAVTDSEHTMSIPSE